MLATRLALATACLLPLEAGALPRLDQAPDQVRMNDGTELRGLIIQNTPDLVVLETDQVEARIPKEYIRRIDDAPNGEAIFADITDRDALPSWR